MEKLKDLKKAAENGRVKCEPLLWMCHLYCKSEMVRDFTVQHLFGRPVSSSDAPFPYGRDHESEEQKKKNWRLAA